MWPNPQFAADLVTFTEGILNGKLQFLCCGHYLTWSRLGLKLNLHHLRKKSTGFKMVVLTPKSGIDKIIICAHQKYWILKCKLNFKCKLTELAWYFKSSIKVGAAQHKCTLGCSLELKNLIVCWTFLFFLINY